MQLVEQGDQEMAALFSAEKRKPSPAASASSSSSKVNYSVLQGLFSQPGEKDGTASGTLSNSSAASGSVAGGASLLHVYLTGARVMSPLVLQDPDRRFDSVEESNAEPDVAVR